MNFIGEIAWTIMAPTMLFLSVYSIYCIVKDKKRSKENQKLNPVHKRAILFGNIIGWIIALYMIFDHFNLLQSQSLSYIGPFLCLLSVLGLVVTIRIFSPKYEKGAPENMYFWGTTLAIAIFFAVMVWILIS